MYDVYPLMQGYVSNVGNACTTPPLCEFLLDPRGIKMNILFTGFMKITSSGNASAQVESSSRVNRVQKLLSQRLRIGIPRQLQ